MKKIIFIFTIATSVLFAACGKPCDGKDCTDKNCKHHQTGAVKDTTKILSAAVYDCPMHCEGAKSDKAGTCPKCKMDLEKQ